MSTQRCFISGCVNDTSKRCTSKPLEEAHYFGGRRCSREIREQWLKVIPQRWGKAACSAHAGPYIWRTFDFNNGHHVLCQLHFEDKFLVKGHTYTIKGEKVLVPVRWTLTPDAVPTKLLNIGKRNGKVVKATAVNIVKTEGKVKRKGGVLRPLHRRRSKRNRRSSSSSSEDYAYSPPPSPAAEQWSGDEGPGLSSQVPAVAGETKVNLNSRDFYCAICMETFPEHLDYFKFTISKEAAYLKFIKLIGKYLGIPDLEDVERRLRLRDDHMKRQQCGVYRTMCDKCGGIVETICKLFGEMELLKIRLNQEILKISQTTDKKGGRWILDKRIELTRRLGIGGKNKIEDVMAVIDGVKKKRKKYLNPRIELKTVEDVGGENDEKGSSQAQQSKEHPMIYNNLVKVKKDKLVILSSSSGNDEEQAVAKGSENTLIFWRPSSLLNLWGFKDVKIISCQFCDKCFLSKMELEEHKEDYHFRIGRRIRAVTTVITAATENMTEEAEASTSARNGNQQDYSVDTTSMTTSTSNVDNNKPTNENNQDLPDLDDVTSPFCLSPVLSEFGDDNHEDMDMGEPDPEPHITAAKPDVNQAPQPVSEEPPPVLEIKDDPLSSAATATNPKKVPFMSSEYIGKYKIVCKLMNIKTGKTCVGVVAKTPTTTNVTASSAISQSSADATSLKPPGSGDLPKVISVEPDVVIPGKRKNPKPISIPPIPGPPYKCPLEGCTKEYNFKNLCKIHYRCHKRRMDKIQELIQNSPPKVKERKKRKRKQPRTPMDDCGLELSPPKRPPIKRNRRQGLLKAVRSRRCNPDNPRKFSCPDPKCHLRFMRQENLDYHQSTRHLPLPCHFCSEMQPCLYKLVSHELSEHSRIPPSEDVPSCPRCEQQSPNFKIPLRLQSHYAREHYSFEIPKPIFHRPSCEICRSEPFVNTQHYILHMTDAHGAEGVSIIERDLPHKCDLCMKRFRYPHTLRVHKTMGHEGRAAKGPRTKNKQKVPRPDKPVRYSKPVKSGKPAKPDKRFRSSKPDRPYPKWQCNICGKGFWGSKWFYDTHMQMHLVSTGNSEDIPKDLQKGFMCNICFRWYKSEDNLQRHKNWHDAMANYSASIEVKPKSVNWDEVNEEGYVCQHCGKSFSIYRELWRHFRSHRPKPEPKPPTPRVQVPCPICGKIWPNRGFLKYHLRRVHPEEAPKYEIDPENGYVCHQCGKVYADTQCLNRHIDRYCPGTVNGDETNN